MRDKIAYGLSKVISGIGHPIVLGTLAAIYVNFRAFEIETAIRLSLIIFVFVVIPMLVYLAYKVKKGVYKDFDVSNQKRRNSLYLFAVLVMCVLTAFLFIKEYDQQFSRGVLAVLVLLLAAYGLNQKIKVSLHASFSFLLAVMMMEVEYAAAFSLLLFALLNSYSRIYLKRHTVPEVAIGAALGILIGTGFLFLAV